MGDVRYLRPTLDARSGLEQAFAPAWWDDVYVLADLWMWLIQREKRPAHPSYFMRHAQEWADEYEQMRMWKGEGA